uniref:Uncharacterized protein n=1 Tax=Triticum urartu TaxID=4572 RepID=A0A8R7PNV7_TRIUA
EKQNNCSTREKSSQGKANPTDSNPPKFLSNSFESKGAISRSMLIPNKSCWSISSMGGKNYTR